MIQEKNVTSVRHSVFTFPEGDVVIAFPSNLSQESVYCLGDYLEILMGALRRGALDSAPKEEMITDAMLAERNKEEGER